MDAFKKFIKKIKMLEIKNKYYICTCYVMESSLQQRLENLFARAKRYKIRPKSSSDDSRSSFRAFHFSQTLRISLIGTDKCCYLQRNNKFFARLFSFCSYDFLVTFPFFYFLFGCNQQ